MKKEVNYLKNTFTADLETTKEKDPVTGVTTSVRAWACAINGIEDLDYYFDFNNLDDFFKHVEKMGNVKIYFHNIKFDGSYLLNWLYKHGFEHCGSKSDEKFYDKCFSTTISDMGQFYKLRVVFKTYGKKKHFVEFYDSLKILPFKVKEVAKAFDLPIGKGDLDYDTYRPVGHKITDKERDYLSRDVKIMAMALRVMFQQGMNKMTQASNALNFYKKMIGDLNFKNWFPTPDYDEDVRMAYKGGFTWVNPKYTTREVRHGLVLDVNSLYPWAMSECPLPYSAPIGYDGAYIEDPMYPLYVQQLRCRFWLKKDHIPTIQVKDSDRFASTEYLTSSDTCYWDEDSEMDIVDEDPVVLTLTSVDLKLFFDHYDVEVLEWIGGYKFKSHSGLFVDYVNYWIQEKITATKEKNAGKRTIAKLNLNALYGKFATSPYTQSKIPQYNEETGIISFFVTEPEKKPDSAILYIPVGAFITAYAREKTIRSAQKVYDKFIYADTDSLHLEMELPPELANLTNDDLEKMTTEDFRKAGVDFPEDFEIDPYALGAWKVESRFFRGKYIRAKTYLEDWNRPDVWDKANKSEFNSKHLKKYCEDNDLDFKEELKKHEGEYDKGILNITCAGMPDTCYDQVTWDNFRQGASFSGKLMPVYVRDGISLEDTVFTIKK